MEGGHVVNVGSPPIEFEADVFGALDLQAACIPISWMIQMERFLRIVLFAID